MIVKNISGESRYFAWIPRGRLNAQGVRGQTLANNATATLPDNDPDVLKKVQEYSDAGVLQIMQGPSDITLLSSVNLPASGYVKGTGAVADNDYVTIAGLKFKWANDPGSGVLGKLYTDYYWAGDGAVQATALDTLKDAVNYNTATTGIVAEDTVAIGADVYLPLRAVAGNVATTGLTLVKSGANLAVSGATLAAGVQGGAKPTALIKRTCAVADVTAGLIVIATALPSISNFIIQVKTSAGAIKAWDGVAAVAGSTFVIDNSGNTDWADTDVITIIAQ